MTADERLWRWTTESALAAALFCGVLLEYHANLSAGVVAAAALSTWPLAWRLELPIRVLAAVCGGFVALGLLGVYDGDAFAAMPVIAVGFALYAVGSRGSGRAVVAGTVVAVLAFAVGIVAAGQPLPRIAVGVGFVALPLLVGRAVGVMSFETDAQAARLEQEREQRAAEAVRAERQRIARELHDVIGHSISIMGVQAGAVRSVLAPEQRREHDALLAVERVGREAMSEMRRLLGLMSVEPDHAAEPTASLRHADRLVDELRAAGLPIRLTTRGDLESLPAGPDLAGYRILQEGLTNAVRHGSPGTITADVACDGSRLTVDVVNPATRGDGEPTGGHGLPGMQERVRVYAGSFAAGPTPDGCFAVHACIPLVGAP